MSDNNMSKKATQEKKKNNIMTYAVIMIISVIIIILIAAMADDREEKIGNRIIETERANESIQNELVMLKDENYKLNKQIEEKDAVNNEYNEYKNRLSEMTNVWNIYLSGDISGAAERLSAIDRAMLDDNQAAYYDALCSVMKISPNADNNQ